MAEAEAVAEAAQCSEAREREVRDLRAAIATQRGKRKWGKRRRLVARAPHGPLHHSLAPCLLLPLLPLLPLQLLEATSSSAASHGPAAEPFIWGLRLQEQGQGVHTDALGAHLKNHPQNHFNYFNTSNSVRRGPRELIKIFFFGQIIN